jgi:hypothetical protein
MSKLGKEGNILRERTVLKKNPNMVTRVIDDETILMPIYKTSEEINCIYSLNEAASRVWQMIDGKKTFSEIKENILKDFDTTPKEVDEKMDNLLKDLKEIKAIVTQRNIR